MTYSIVIPAHNEEAFIGLTLQSLVKQSIIPSEVIVVNDNSNDNTSDVISFFTENFDWIKKIDLKSDNSHQPGSKVVNAFLLGFSELKNPFDIIVKLDADLIIPETYFETIINHFESDPTIGMAGGFAYILKEDKWVLENLTSKDHIRGAFKAYRKACYDQIGGLKPAMGWDTADELIAQFFGWKIKTDESLHIKHLKPTGANYPSRSASKQGVAFYTLGYGFWLTLIASLKLALLKKKITLTLPYIKGYWLAKKNQIPMLLTPEQAAFTRKLRWTKIKQKIFHYHF